MSEPTIILDDETNKILQNIQKQYNLKNKEEVISKLAKEFIGEELNPKYVKKANLIAEEEKIYVKNTHNLKKRYSD